ncbi:MAG: hypothetical protein DME25_05315 [Verrucomicrobia bacterium]|nr:MAG: hypothetical protein DME25_05315 [Verrucomicrobiota bacterium]
MVVLDTTSGKPVSDLPIAGDTDDLFYDARRKRLYLSCGQGSVEVVEQPSPNDYKLSARIATSAGARTSLFSPELDRFYLAVPERGSQTPGIRIYQPQ